MFEIKKYDPGVLISP